MNLKSIVKNSGLHLERFFQEVELRTGIPCSKPSEVWLKITERCNCRCQMCDIWKQNISADGELTTSDWENVLLGLRQWLGKKHIWFTGGEPFLRKDCIELVRYSSSIGLSIGVITNGILLKPDHMPLLIEAGLKEYHVSIDSMNPDIHDHLRGIKGVHRRVTENVLTLKKLLDKSEKRMKIVIKTIIMGYNAKEILPLVEWAEKNRFDEIVFQPLESNLQGEDSPQWFNNSPFWPKGKEIDEIAEMLDKLIIKKQAGSNIIHNSPVELKSIKEYFLDPVASYDKAKDHILSNTKHRRGCKSGVRWMEILSRGGLRMCRYMPPLGDVREKNPQELWKNRPACWKKPVNLCLK